MTASNVWGGREAQKYIVEVKGSGLGFINYNNDDWLDIYLSNGIRFEETYTPAPLPLRIFTETTGMGHLPT